MEINRQPKEMNSSLLTDNVFEGYEDDCIIEQYVDSVGMQFVFRFDNNNGASVVKLDEPESKDKPYELAVVRFHSDDNNEWLTYPENGVTDKSGILLNLSQTEMLIALNQVKGL